MPAILAVLGKAATAFLLKLIMSLATERFIKWLFFYLGEQIAKSTKTDQDDIFLAKIKDAYEQYDSGKNSSV
jgi:hypothetical protein